MSFKHYYITTFVSGRERQVLKKTREQADKYFKQQCDASTDAKINPDTDIFLLGYNEKRDEVQIIQTFRNYHIPPIKRK